MFYFLCVQIHRYVRLTHVGLTYSVTEFPYKMGQRPNTRKVRGSSPDGNNCKYQNWRFLCFNGHVHDKNIFLQWDGDNTVLIFLDLSFWSSKFDFQTDEGQQSQSNCYCNQNQIISLMVKISLKDIFSTTFLIFWPRTVKYYFHWMQDVPKLLRQEIVRMLLFHCIIQYNILSNSHIRFRFLKNTIRDIETFYAWFFSPSKLQLRLERSKICAILAKSAFAWDFSPPMGEQ